MSILSLNDSVVENYSRNSKSNPPPVGLSLGVNGLAEIYEGGYYHGAKIRNHDIFFLFPRRTFIQGNLFGCYYVFKLGKGRGTLK